MREIVFAIPGDLALPTGGYAYDRRLLHEWQRMGVPARHLALPGGFPFPRDEDLALTGELLRRQDREAVLLLDGLAYGAFPPGLAREFAGRVIALVHHPLACETGLDAGQASALKASETQALRETRAVVVTSPTTQRLLVQDYAVPGEKIAVAVPGVDPAPRARGAARPGPLALLAVGSLVPRKGYDVLVSALARLKDRDWRLTIVGAQDRAPQTARALDAQIAEYGLQDRIALAGAIDDAALAQAYDAAELFVMPSLFEGYGMVLTEALARGLPIVCTTGGAAAETAPDAAALKIPPGDAEALAKALASLIDDRAARRTLSDAAWRAAETLPRWRETATIVAETCRKVA